ncbi:MAG: MBL fold metallo-hydrolase [Clostridiales Family XIII bacterium]|jgi:phosphoribosyl 1,2-cyclic phosphodiesterase|nr:MBL fold metallo-hydrolase [Clostridiales Family XIII bacterium]
MGFDFCSFSSGSNGNCYLIKTEDAAILIDAGISGKRVWEGLQHTDTNPETLRALLITHEHSDHIGGLASVMKKGTGLKVYANKETWRAIGPAANAIAEERIHHFVTGDCFTVGDISVKTFAVSHDAAEPVGYTLRCQGRQISVVTDTGCVNAEITEEIRDANLLVLESNHDEDMLKYGKYPHFLKKRVLGDAGHLSNIAAGGVILDLLTYERKKRRVLLAHLSRENNFPEMAMQTIRNILEEHGYHTGADVYLETVPRSEIGLLYAI